MKSFLEQYGFAILSAIVVIILILMVSPVGNQIKKSTTDIVNTFGETGQKATVSTQDVFASFEDNDQPVCVGSLCKYDLYCGDYECDWIQDLNPQTEEVIVRYVGILEGGEYEYGISWNNTVETELEDISICGYSLIQRDFHPENEQDLSEPIVPPEPETYDYDVYLVIQQIEMREAFISSYRHIDAGNKVLMYMSEDGRAVVHSITDDATSICNNGVGWYYVIPEQSQVIEEYLQYQETKTYYINECSW